MSTKVLYEYENEAQALVLCRTVTVSAVRLYSS
jgi:hypothetical protein